MGLGDLFKKKKKVDEKTGQQTVQAPDDGEEDTAEHDTGEHLMSIDTGTREEDWANWDPDDAEEGWFKYFIIEDAQQNGGPALFRRRLNEYGIRDDIQWAVVRTTFVKKHGQNSQAMAAALTRQKKQMTGG